MSNNKIIREVEYLKLDHLRYFFKSYENNILSGMPSQVIFTGTGRAALRLILEHFYRTGVLKDKNDEILINKWMCMSVIHTMHRFSHPVHSLTNGLKIVMVYHQYGYPQNMDEICEYCKEKGLILIEDCANVYESYYKNKRLGTFGAASIFSLSKMFPSGLGGVLCTSDPELIEYANSRMKESKWSWFIYSSRGLFESFSGSRFSSLTSDIQEMSYGITDTSFRINKVSLKAAGGQISNGIFNRRKRNYAFLLDYFKDRCEYFGGLEKENVVPFVVPFFTTEKDLMRIKKILLDINIHTGVYHFDINRNLLNPKFVKCVWVPVHQGISLDGMARICGLIKEIVE